MGHRHPDGLREALQAALVLPFGPTTRAIPVLAVAVVALETVGLLARRTCTTWTCGPTAGAWAVRWDMDALGSVPRTLVVVVLTLVALACLRGVLRAGRAGASVWWLFLAGGCVVLAASKQTSLHSLVEVQLSGRLPVVDVQLSLVVVSLAGLVTAIAAGRWVRRDVRTPVVTWLALVATASVGLAAVTVVLAPLGPLVADLSTFVEETGEGLAAIGLLAPVLVVSLELAGRRKGQHSAHAL